MAFKCFRNKQRDLGNVFLHPTNFGLNVLFPHIYVALEKKAESSRNGADYAEVDKRIMIVKGEVPISVKTKVKSAKEKFNTKVAGCTTKEESLEKNGVIYE